MMFAYFNIWIRIRVRHPAKKQLWRQMGVGEILLQLSYEDI